MAMNIALLLFAAAIWGMGFVASKWTLIAFTPLWSNSLRFAVAALVSLPLLLAYRTFKKPRAYFQKGLIASAWLFWGVFFQVIGLKHTTVAKSGFITSLYALFIPVILCLGKKKTLGKAYWALLMVAMLGIALLCGLKFDGFNAGDFYTLLCALAFAFHILYLEKIADSIPSGFEFNCLQSLFIGAFGVILGLCLEGAPDLSPLLPLSSALAPGPLAGLLFLGILSSIVAFGIQVYTQKLIPSHIVGPIFLLESPFAAFFGVLLLGEVLTPMHLWGCVLVMVSVGAIPLIARGRKAS